MAVGRFFSGFLAILKKNLKSSGTTLKTILVMVLVFGLEQIFEKDVFECPGTRYSLYGTLFLCGPAVCLFSLTLLLNTSFWEVLTGCHLSGFRRRWVANRVVQFVFQALLPPGVWLFVALIQTNYYVCARMGLKDIAIQTAVEEANGTIATREVKRRIEEAFKEAGAESHIIAWILFISLVILAFVAVCIRRCWFMRAEGILLDLDEYDQLEAEAAAEHYNNQMRQLAAEVGETYVTKKIEEAKKKELESGHEHVTFIHDELSLKYPRTTGDLSQPYRKDLSRCERMKTTKNGYDVEMKMVAEHVSTL